MDESPAMEQACLSCAEELYFLQETCPDCGETHDWHYVAQCEACGEETDYLTGECEDCGETYSPWRVIEKEMLATGEPISVPKSAVDRPSSAGYQRHLGTIRGQWADYRRQLETGSEFHVQVYREYYEIHLDDVSAIEDPTLHMIRYTPRVIEITSAGFIEGVQRTILRTGRMVSNSLKAPFIFLPDLDQEDS